MSAAQSGAAQSNAAQSNAAQSNGAGDLRALAATALTLGYGGDAIVHDVDLTLRPGSVTAIVGANASGKSTLLRGFARLLAPTSGVVTLGGDDVRHLRSRTFATEVGLLPQQPVAPEGLSVADLVARGRYPHQGWLRAPSTHDDVVVRDALAATGTLELADRTLDELSGGQRQRVWIAMALAQEPRILLLDEPTTFLDVTHQIDVLDLLVDLNRDRGTTVVLVLHDLNLAARYADELVVLARGRIAAVGRPADVLTADLMRDAFGLDSVLTTDPVSGTPLIVPVGRHHRPASPQHTQGEE